jgi:hypothetical protein
MYKTAFSGKHKQATSVKVDAPAADPSRTTSLWFASMDHQDLQRRIRQNSQVEQRNQLIRQMQESQDALEQKQAADEAYIKRVEAQNKLLVKRDQARLQERKRQLKQVSHELQLLDRLHTQKVYQEKQKDLDYDHGAEVVRVQHVLTDLSRAHQKRTIARSFASHNYNAAQSTQEDLNLQKEQAEQ